MSNATTIGLQDVPHDVLCEIMRHTDPKTLESLAAVSEGISPTAIQVILNHAGFNQDIHAPIDIGRFSSLAELYAFCKDIDSLVRAVESRVECVKSSDVFETDLSVIAKLLKSRPRTVALLDKIRKALESLEERLNKFG